MRALFNPRAHPAFWTTERRERISKRSVNETFAAARDAAGLEAVLDLHCLRHSYTAYAIEFGCPEKFVHDQGGHRYAVGAVGWR